MSNNYNTKSIYTVALNELLNVNVNSESLKVFLENVVNAINNQSKQLQSFQQQLEGKADKEEVEKGFKSVSDSINIYDNELLKTINNVLEKPKQENTGNKVEDGANKVCNKIVMLGHACTIIYRANKGWEKKLDELALEIPKKLERDEMKIKVKKTKTKLVNELEEIKRKLNKQMDELSKKTVTQINKFEIEVKDVEKKTLWKIQDCEQLLSKRITGEFVDNSIKCLEDKIRREMLKMKEENFGGINSAIEDLEDKFKAFEENNTDKIKNVKQQLKDVEDSFANKFALNEKYETNKKIVQDKISEIETRLITLDRKGDANQFLEQSRELVRQLEAKLYDQERQLNELVDQVSILGSRTISSDKKQKSGNGDDDCIDPHKLCLLEANLKRLRDEFNEQKRNYATLEQDIRRKFDTFEHKVLGNFALLKKQNQSDFNRDEIIGLIERGKVIAEEKVKQLVRELEDIRPKMNGISELEKKIKKKFRDMSENSELSQKIAEKADIIEVNRQNNFLEEKVRQLTDTVQSFKREFEQIEDFYMQLNTMIKSNQQEAISVITGNTKVIPNRCVACGTKGKQVHNMTDMKGYDGKIYKADFSGASAYDNQEVFDIYPSQISPEKVSGFNYSSKQQLISFKERPTSSKGNERLQNSSGKK
ncbi:hypothetical protein ABPG72_000051 [Tetrahymena utriculariae]